jgi:DNA repair and recombination RAD54-like protein
VCADAVAGFVIISNFTSTLDIFEKVLQLERLPFKRLDGSMAAQKRQDCVDTFNTDTSFFAFLLSSKAGGCGINLIGANRLVLFDPDWNPAIDNQALARVWRSGQQKPCYVYRFFGVGSLEEVCHERQCAKEGLSDEIVDGDDAGRKFSNEDLKSLFSPTFDAACRSSFHARMGCTCCQPGAPYPPPEDARGFVHLKPETAALHVADACLARAASQTARVTLVFGKVTDQSGRGFAPPPPVAAS